MADRSQPPARLEAGQAQIELVAAVPFVLLAVLIVIQLFGVLYAQSVVDGAAEAAALAAADGRDSGAAARDALPGWARDRVEVDVVGGRVRVEAAPVAVIPWIGRRLSVTSRAYVRPAG